MPDQCPFGHFIIGSDSVYEQRLFREGTMSYRLMAMLVVISFIGAFIGSFLSSNVGTHPGVISRIASRRCARESGIVVYPHTGSIRTEMNEDDCHEIAKLPVPRALTANPKVIEFFADQTDVVAALGGGELSTTFPPPVVIKTTGRNTSDRKCPRSVKKASADISKAPEYLSGNVTVWQQISTRER